MSQTASAFEGDRLAKVIARAGLCSRRDAELWIKDGRVAVNGKVIRTPAFNVTEKDQVKVDGTPLAAAYTRMKTDREQEAATIRAGGAKDAQIIRAEAEAEAAQIYAAAYGKDPEFYDFYRAMASYRRTFETGTGESSFILSPDNAYLRQFRGVGR